jgi:hypothetical protein
MTVQALQSPGPGRTRRHSVARIAAACLVPPLAGCAVTPSGAPAPEQAALQDGPVPFSSARDLGALPGGWHTHLMRRDRSATDYHLVQRDGRRVLEAHALRASSGLRCDVDIDPLRTPWLSWSWRVDQFPSEASIADDDRDDSPARLVLTFDGDSRTLRLRDRMFSELVEMVTGQPLPFATLMYAWDGEAAPEQVIAYPRSARIQYLVVERGAQRTGRWLSYRRNVRDDYRRVYGSEPGRIRQVGVLCDSDDLQLELMAWFGDIAFAATSR